MISSVEALALSGVVRLLSSPLLLRLDETGEYTGQEDTAPIDEAGTSAATVRFELPAAEVMVSMVAGASAAAAVSVAECRSRREG